MRYLSSLFAVVAVWYGPSLSICGAEPAAAQETAWYGRFNELPLTEIQPEGWLAQYLVHQRDGLTGHLENAGYPFDTVGWAADKIPNNHSIEDWWPYEQNAYWVDGMLRCGLLLRDDGLIQKAHRSIDYVLAHPAPNGFLGPKLAANTAEIGRWIHVVFFRALMADFAATHDPEIVAALKRHYLAGDYSYKGGRDVLNVEAMLWTYRQSHDPALLELARKSYADFNAANTASQISAAGFLRDTPATGEHGVNYDETAKIGALLYLATGYNAYLQPSIAAFRKLDKYHLLVSGVNVSSEHLQPVTTTESSETCDISDYTWSAGYLLMATGDASYADKIERVAFNAAPGGVTGDFKALQYFTAPNQVVCTHTSCVPTGGSQMSYSPNPGTECCPGNVNRMMPNFAARLWMTDADGNLAAVMYAPSHLTHRLPGGSGTVEIREVTRYPFEPEIRFEIKTGSTKPVRLPLTLRIPGWCQGAKLSLNGRDLGVNPSPGSFYRLDHEFRDGDNVTLLLPQHFALENGPDGTVSVVRGPLVFALKVEEDWRIDRSDTHSTTTFPAYDLWPKSPWNYALCLDSTHLDRDIQVATRPWNDTPWTLATAPVELRVAARAVRGWTITEATEVKSEHWDIVRDPTTGKVKDWVKSGFDTQRGHFYFTPPVPEPKALAANLDEKTTTVILVPYGSSKLRITYFPTVSASP